MTATDPASLQGRRPRNRRDLILAAAGDLFAERGYEHVTLGDVAAAVAVGPSALYRHFSGKEDLLTEVLLAAMRPLAHALGETADRPEAALDAVIGVALDQRTLGVLLQRETRHLTGEHRAVVGQAAREVGSPLASLVRRSRPDLDDAAVELLVWAVYAALVSPSFTDLDMPRAAWVESLAGICRRVQDFDVPETWQTSPRESVAGSLEHGSRREAILWKAIELFADRTYASVSMGDVGASLGIMGPSVYAHFENKHEILATAMTRGAAVLEMDVAAAISSSSTAHEALGKLIDRYVRFALEHHRMVSLLVTEMRNLEGTARELTAKAQTDYVAEWTRLLRLGQPDLTATQARFAVLACLMVVNTLVRRSSFRLRHDATVTMTDIARRVLGLPPAAGPGCPEPRRDR